MVLSCKVYRCVEYTVYRSRRHCMYAPLFVTVHSVQLVRNKHYYYYSYNYKVNLYCLALGLGHLNYQVGTINASDYFDPRYEYRAADVARHIKICYTTDVIAIY